MINLIKNEFIKIFKKKGIYVTFVIIFAFIILINVLFNYASDIDMNVYYYEEYPDYDYEKERLKVLDPENVYDIGEYLSIKTSQDLRALEGKYEDDTWQKDMVSMQMYGYIYEINQYTYGLNKDEEMLKQAKENYNKIIAKLDKGDWRYFVNEEISQYKNELKSLEEQKAYTDDKNMLANIEEQIFSVKVELEVLEMRLIYDIAYGRDYLNSAFDNYKWNTMCIRAFENMNEKTYDDERAYQSSLENKAMAEYIIENKEDVYGLNLRQILMNIFSQYNLFIVIIIVMIAGSLVSDEFSKGTVKLWLVRPHSRVKMLLAKFITSMIMILVTMTIVVIMQLLVGGIIFGFDSLKIPALVYDFNAGELVTMNVFKYMLISGAAYLPFFILIATIAFAISTVLSNTAIAITIAILGYISNDIINALVYQFDIQFMRYFITMNWHLNDYMFGRLPMAEYLSFGFSAIICTLYFVVLLVPTFIIFKKKNIKNV